MHIDTYLILKDYVTVHENRLQIEEFHFYLMFHKTQWGPVPMEPSVNTATCSGSIGCRGRYDAMVIKASSLTDSCWYMTVSLVCPGLRNAILMNVHAPSGRDVYVGFHGNIKNGLIGYRQLEVHILAVIKW